MAKFETGICSNCGAEYENHYEGEIADIMKEQGVCFKCAFWIWQHRIDCTKRENHSWAIIDGTHYVLCPHTDINWPVGFGGTVYRIRFNDGFETVCDNLWCQGVVPERFRDVMPDNAKFI